MIRSAIFVLGLALAASAPLVASAQAASDAASPKKKPKKKKARKKKGGSFTSCAALTTKADCDAHAKDHSCSWDAIAAGGSCGEGAPM